MNHDLIYIVVKKGVYRHEIVGAYDLVLSAENRAHQACAEEDDDYHAFQILEVQKNVAVEDGKLIAIVSRIEDEISLRRVK